MGNDTPVMLTIKEAAAETKLAEHFIRQLCLTGRIVNVRAGKKYLVNYHKLVDYLNAGDQQPEVEQSGKIRRLG